jgi:hypothetical protein
MGLELALGALSLVVGIAGGIAQANTARAAANEQRETRAISSARDKTVSMENRRERVREERIRRARILAQSENTGTSDSSGQIGAIGALSTNLAGMIGSSLGESRANQAINTSAQRAADLSAKANEIGAWTNTIQKGIGGFQSVFD